MSTGTSFPHDAAHLHVTGAARYVDDIPTPSGTLHLAFGLSTTARGKINAMDLARVRQAAGVVAVLTADDLPFANDVSPSNHDEPLLAKDTVHYTGQPLFLVIATSHLAARKGARLADISISPEVPILTIDAALAADSRFEDGPRIYTKGDPDTALASARHRLSGSLEIGGQEHFYLEGQAALVLPGENGDMLVQSSTQHPTEIQHKVAEAIGLPMHAVRVETRRMGGGFGGKESQGNALAVACAVGARLTQKPCKMRYDRDDDMIITGKRHDFRITYDAGFDDTGRLTALDFTHYVRCGWAMDLSLPVADRAMLHADNAYHLSDVRITSHRLKTNTQSATAFRGFGGPQGIVGIERVMDHIAAHLLLDPLDVRRANFYRDSDLGSPSLPTPEPELPGTNGDLTTRGARVEGSPAVTAPPVPEGAQTTPYMQPVTDCIINTLTDRLALMATYRNRRDAVTQWNAQNPILKRGLALTPVKFGISFTLTHLNQAGALVHVYQDGSIHLNHGGTEMGQGLFQKVAQIAASEFGVPLAQVKITATDTGKVPNTSATAASSGTDLNGMAVLNACKTIRERMSDYFATLHNCPTDEITFHDGHVTAGTTTLTFAQAAQKTYEARISLSATGFYKTPDIQWDRIKGLGRPFFYFAYGAAITEVVIDTLTGENRILRADILHDAGQSLNPALDVGQIEGGYVQGAGWLTTEELVWDEKGALKTHAPATYKIPACSDRPDIFNVALWDRPNPARTVYRSKAVGEPPFMLGISAWSALADAVRSCGPTYADLQTPATAEEVLRAVQKAQGDD
ncbi:xanthine dehydrogenase molybdopterin binding subunit [Sulfitobacter guttiformis]|uniref:Aldehyde oxidoreductase molybdenum-binding subunit PaoC n=1 Tax=Sulfitobacter guttiformis TaxID=74349 RepID=A0A420DTZ0_9RHOB|nr:xanthine dehydrogenase molybdopterin binding subunit [Sulfitobacter guttiformis]KIN71302.1 Xanthine dehydrogenase, large subunit [Sulfitobacter guttiformis KCTC 32187]RKE97756.1 xanthine dehydrogenase molybdenum binding subunit apoprotein [Sulfitobacter guttiformis]